MNGTSILRSHLLSVRVYSNQAKDEAKVIKIKRQAKISKNKNAFSQEILPSKSLDLMIRMHFSRMRTTRSLLYEGQRPHGQRPPWTETETPILDRDPPRGQRFPWTETSLMDRNLSPGQRPTGQCPPRKEPGTRDRDPPGRNMGTGSQTGSGIIPSHRGQNDRHV